MATWFASHRRRTGRRQLQGDKILRVDDVVPDAHNLTKRCGHDMCQSFVVPGHRSWYQNTLLTSIPEVKPLVWFLRASSRASGKRLSRQNLHAPGAAANLIAFERSLQS